MNVHLLVILGGALVVTGCTNNQLRRSTVTQTSMLTEVQHQVVLNNLAAFAFNPNSIPFHATLSEGTAQITDTGSIATQLLRANARTLDLTATRNATDFWSMKPVTDDTTLRLLQVAYRRAFDPSGDLYTTDLANDLAHELKKQTTTVDDLRSTSQIGNSGLIGYKPVDPDTPTMIYTKDSSTSKSTEKPSPPTNITSSKIEPNVLGFNNEAANRYFIENASVLSSNDQFIILPGEFLGRDAMIANDPELIQVAMPSGTAEKITIKKNQINTGLLRLTDPRDGLSQEFRIERLIPERANFDARHALMEPDSPDARNLRKYLHSIKLNLDAISQNFYRNSCVFSSVDIDEVTDETITALVIKLSFPSPLSQFQQKAELISDGKTIDFQPDPRFLTATPLAAELRRQVADVERSLLEIQPGWVGKSRDKHDVPPDACYQAHWRDCCGDSYVWVCAAGRGQFEDFTIKILGLSTLIKDVSVSGAAGVKFTPGSAAAALPAGR